MVQADIWIERLILLRRSHLAEWEVFHIQEIQYRRELTQQYENEKPFYISTFEKAMLIQRQLDRIVELSRDRDRRYKLLKKAHMVELYKLFQLKNSLSWYDEAALYMKKPWSSG
ncbi:hypothetical protein [Spirosoma aerophilum]